MIHSIRTLHLATLALILLSACGRDAAPPPLDPSLWSLPGSRVVERAYPIPLYSDRRPIVTRVIPARDHGAVLRHGLAPGGLDRYGARDVWVYESDGTYYMHYDAAGPEGWLAALATSTDLVNWEHRGAVLTLGRPGEEDARSASYAVTYRDANTWHMFYLGTPNATSPPERIPMFPYVTMKATASSPAGPWRKQPAVKPFRPKGGTYYAESASPGHIIPHRGEYLQFFSASAYHQGKIRRTIGIARTRDLNGEWKLDLAPILPPEEQIENASLYYEPVFRTWFLFTNHVGVDAEGREDTDAIWVYWSQDPNRWSTRNKALVLDGTMSNWSQGIIGLPSVLKVGDRLAIFYDGLQGPGRGSHMRRDIGLAWLDLPLHPPMPD